MCLADQIWSSIKLPTYCIFKADPLISIEHFKGAIWTIFFNRMCRINSFCLRNVLHATQLVRACSGPKLLRWRCKNQHFYAPSSQSRPLAAQQTKLTSYLAVTLVISLWPCFEYNYTCLTILTYCTIDFTVFIHSHTVFQTKKITDSTSTAPTGRQKKLTWLASEESWAMSS